MTNNFLKIYSLQGPLNLVILLLLLLFVELGLVVVVIIVIAVVIIIYTISGELRGIFGFEFEFGLI